MNMFIRLMAVLATTAFMPWSAIAQTPADSISPSRNERGEYVQGIVATAGGLAINAAITEGLKKGVHEMRPDRSGNNSFPSRHTSWAYAGATGIATALYSHNPWWAVGAHSLAGAVAFQRVASRHHWGSDAVTGAVVGIASAELSNVLVRLAFGSKSPLSYSSDNNFCPSFSFRSEAIYHLGGNDGNNLRTGWGNALTMRLPLSERWGVSASTHASTTPVKINGQFAGVLSGVGMTVGTVMHTPLPCCALAVTSSLECGFQKWLGPHIVRRASAGFRCDAEIGLEWRLTPRFAFRPAASYTLLTSAGVCSAITLSLASSVVF